MRIKLQVICALVAIGGSFTGQARANLVSNGGFETGVIGPATTDYILSDNFGPPNLGTVATTYAILGSTGTVPPSNPNFSVFGPLSGSYMMVVNGATAANTTVWQDTFVVSVNTTYVVSGWMTNAYATSPAVLDFTIGGGSIGTITNNSPNGTWQQFTGSWYSGSNTSATLRIVDTNLDANGNDFALDDISVSATPEPGFYALLGLGLSGLAVVRRKLTKNS